MRRFVQYLFIISLLCAVVSGCGDAPGGASAYDRPALRVPLQVYPEQTFFLDATRSRRSNGEISGFIFNPGDASGEIYTREPLVAYNYTEQGEYTVSVRLFEGASREQATISVVSCDQYLACAPPLRPCPPGYECNDQSLCAPEQPTCLVSADCPFPLECREGACGPGGPCASWPGPRPNPSADATLDTHSDDADTNNTDTNNTDTNDTNTNSACETHLDCAASTFCVENTCTETPCDDACINDRLQSTELLRVFLDHRITGLAYLPNYSDAFFAISLTGRIWRRTDTYSDEMFGIQEIYRPEVLPPKYIGTVDMNGVESALNDVGPQWPYWTGFDLSPIAEDSELFGESRLVNFLPIADGFPIPRVDAEQSELLVSQIGRGIIGASRFEWLDATEAVTNSYFDSQTLTVAEYWPSQGEVRLTVDGVTRASAPYTAQLGAAVCAVATDGRYVFLAENRVTTDANDHPSLGAARIIQIDMDQGVVVDFWPSLIGSACALELGKNPNTLMSVQYIEDKVPFLAIYRYNP